MVPMHSKRRKRLSINRKAGCSQLAGRRRGEDTAPYQLAGSWSQCRRKNERGLSMNLPSFRPAADRRADNAVCAPWHSASTRYAAAIRLRALALMLCVPLLQAAEDPSPIQFKDVTRQSGITFVHTDGSSGRHYIVESVASGLATFDYNGDGKIDILFLNGAPLPGSPTTTPPPRNALYRNDGGWKFTDVTQAAGLGDTNYHLGVCIGDYDNDGHADIYLNHFGPNILHQKNGDGNLI